MRSRAIKRRQSTRPRQSMLEMDPQDRHAPPAPLPAGLVAQSAADRAEAEEQRERVRQVRQRIEHAKRAARAASDAEKLAELDGFSRRFERSVSTRANALDCY